MTLHPPSHYKLGVLWLLPVLQIGEEVEEARVLKEAVLGQPCKEFQQPFVLLPAA